MSRAQFTLAYDGPSLRNGTMDVNELAPALLATADMVRQANHQLNGDAYTISIKVRSDFKKGSFEVGLIVDQNLLEHAKSLLFPTSLVGAGSLVTFLFGTDVGKKGLAGVAGSVLDLWKKLKGEKPKTTIEDANKGVTIIITGDNNEITVDSAVAKLYNENTIRSSVARTLKPLTSEGVDSLEIKRGKKTVNAVTRMDLPPMLDLAGDSTAMALLSGPEEPSPRSGIRETWLRVTRANFEKGKWGFSDGTANFSADIEDEDFKRKLDAGEVGFFKGDILFVVLATTQAVSRGDAFRTTYTIQKVIEHRHAPRQVPLRTTDDTLLSSPQAKPSSLGTSDSPRTPPTAIAGGTT
jgi:hypothetical protein